MDIATIRAAITADPALQALLSGPLPSQAIAADGKLLV